MNIIWQYLDKRNGAINALQDYNSMQHIIDHTDEEIANVSDRMTSLGSPSFSDTPRSGSNPQGNENRIIAAIDEIDVLRERFRQAVEYMDWFQPAWEQLTEDERYVLESFYSDVNCYGSNAAYYIASYFGIEQSSAYKRKNRALDHLTVLLFGKS
jgi:DNA-directed RNA polymerase specialized sigma subunit